MYMRLWWKDARQFWPIWAFLVLAAGVTQLLMNAFAGVAERGNLLVPMAMGWTCLYAFAVGAAAFAGERETGTLRLLDLLPAPRRVVWMGKVSFAIVTHDRPGGDPAGRGRARCDRAAQPDVGDDR